MDIVHCLSTLRCVLFFFCCCCLFCVFVGCWLLPVNAADAHVRTNWNIHWWWWRRCCWSDWLLMAWWHGADGHRVSPNYDDNDGEWCELKKVEVRSASTARNECDHFQYVGRGLWVVCVWKTEMFVLIIVRLDVAVYSSRRKKKKKKKTLNSDTFRLSFKCHVALIIIFDQKLLPFCVIFSSILSLSFSLFRWFCCCCWSRWQHQPVTNSTLHQTAHGEPPQSHLVAGSYLPSGRHQCRIPYTAFISSTLALLWSCVITHSATQLNHL